VKKVVATILQGSVVTLYTLTVVVLSTC